MSDGPEVILLTFGTFRVIGPGNADLTPRSMKACGVMALLLDAPKFTRARASLQDKLWSDRGQAQGAASLRQALTEIRQALGEARDVLSSDRRKVSLDPDRVSSDWTNLELRAKAESEGGVFLEDLDIKDPEFEDWLRDRRQSTERQLKTPAHQLSPLADPQGRTRSSYTPPHLTLADAGDANLSGLSRHILQGIARGVVDRGSVAVHWAETKTVKPAGALGLKLEIDGFLLGDHQFLRVQMVDLTTGQIGWQLSENLDPSDLSELPRLISEAVDRTVDTLSVTDLRRSGEAGRDRFFLALQQMFQTRGLDFKGLKADFRGCFERDPRGIYLAWEAFLTCYIIGERRVVNLDALKDEARDLVRRAVEMEPHNAVVVALASHVYSFVLGEFEVARELAERSVRLDKNNVLGWTFLGSAMLFCGEIAEGYKCILTARKISGEGPYRHMVDFFASMAAMLSGDFERGIALGETVNALAPDFAPALRYLLAGYLHEKDYVRAENSLYRLRRLEPDFEPRFFAEPDYPVPAMRRAGLLETVNLRSLTAGGDGFG